MGTVLLVAHQSPITSHSVLIKEVVHVLHQKMRNLHFITWVVWLVATANAATNPAESNLLTKLTSAKNAPLDNAKDLTTSASDRTFHLNKEYGQPGSYGTTYPYGNSLSGTGNLIYGPGTPYHGLGLNTGYRGYPTSPVNGIIGGGHVGYGYYGNIGYNPNYGTYGGYRPYGYDGYRGLGGYGVYDNYGGYDRYGGYGTGIGGYGAYDGGAFGPGNGYYAPYSAGNSGVKGYNDNYLGYDNRNRYAGVDEYGYGSNYGSLYNSRYNLDPYGYRGTNYGTNVRYPSGYRGYS